MRTPGRLAALALAATAAGTLAACSTTVTPTVESAPTTSTASMATHRPVAPAAETGRAIPSTPRPTAAAPTPAPRPTAGTAPASGSDLPVPGDGVPGDAGLCQAVAGWYGYATLAVIGASQDGGHVFPDDVVPLLQELASAPDAHGDADPGLLSTAEDIASQTRDVVTEIRHGADAADALSELDQPVTLLGDACSAAGVG